MRMIDCKYEALFQEMTDHLLTDEKPSGYITRLSQDKNYDIDPLKMLWKLKETPQSKKYHPEGSVWNHTMLVLDEAAKVRKETKDSAAFMWAALLHDIGKPGTTRNRNGKITSYDHDKAGGELSEKFLRYLTDDMIFTDKVSSLVRYHMHMLYVLGNLPYGDVRNMLRKVDIYDIALLCLCDRLGRGMVDKVLEETQYNDFLTRLENMTVKH